MSRRLGKFASVSAMFVLIWIAVCSPSHAQQASPESDVYAVLKADDSRLFDVGFNGHDIRPFEELIDDDFEFYHDKGGATLGKAAFLESIKNGIFNLSYKARRELTPGSLKVYPLEKNGVLYGAIQMGEHRFYA